MQRGSGPKKGFIPSSKKSSPGSLELKTQTTALEHHAKKKPSWGEELKIRLPVHLRQKKEPAPQEKVKARKEKKKRGKPN